MLDKEIWKDIPGYEGLYKISSYGRVYSNLTKRMRKDVNSGRGYRAIQLSDRQHTKKRFYIHRLVAITFLGPPPKGKNEINHKNLDKTDNRIDNLEWVSGAENMEHAYKNGKTDYRRPMRCDNKTGVKGVYRNGGGYEVEICGIYIGWYKDLERAIKARRNAERCLYE